ncbi:MAG: YigZ family protein [Pseudomonadota bacterium]
MTLETIDHVLTDKGSKYAVSGAPAQSKTQAVALISELKRTKKFAKATHNTWGLLLSDGPQLKNDDGESGAGLVILRTLEQRAVYDTCIIVTRWYGGVHLGGDRFRHVGTCVKAWLDAFRA